MDFSVIYSIFKGILLALLINASLHLLFNYSYLTLFNPAEIVNNKVSILGWVVGSLNSFVFIIGTRLFANYVFNKKKSEKRVVIYGAGAAGIQLARALKVSHEMQPIAFIDKDKSLNNTFIGDLRVFNPRKLERLIHQRKVDEVLIAIPSASRALLRELLREIEDYSVKVRILPGLAELAQGKVLVSELKEVEISDLLGRYEVEANKDLLNKNIQDKVVLITGAGGSIGSEITRQVIRSNPKKVIILDSNEYALYAIKNEIESLDADISLYSVLASVTNKKRIQEILQIFKVDTIYHSAAYKHVPLVEENPFEGVTNNIFGTLSCLEAAIDAKVNTFVLISTDKAVRPTNIMGATKRFSEMILQSYSDDLKVKQVTRITMVRFGNVLGSSGSAIPLFQKQIKEGGPVTVTDPAVTRYFMSIPEAAELVIQAGAMGEGGDVFVLDMGEPVKIIDLAKRLIRLNGLYVKDENNPNGDIEVSISGLRPGEKLFEELLIGDNVSSTVHKQIHRAEEDYINKDEIMNYIQKLKNAELNNDVLALKQIFKEVIDGYDSEEEIVDVISLQNKKIET
tara:strand:- start:1875 stop:3581 length:1707 start_codon:yes stop_codon:yes gene_type:complete